MEDLFRRWTEHLDNIHSRVNQPPLITCDFCGGEHANSHCHLYFTNNSGWGQESSPYDQYEERGTLTLESVFEEFMAYNTSSKENQNVMNNQEIDVAKSYSIEKSQGTPELELYNQGESERGANLDNLLMQFEETTESTQLTFTSVEIQASKLAKDVTQCVARIEEDIVEIEAQEEIPTKEHELREKDEMKGEEKTQQWEEYLQQDIQQESMLQINTLPHQLIFKKQRQGEQKSALSVFLFGITNPSSAMSWHTLPEYMKFMEFLAKRWNCKEDVFFVTFMPP
ncbi:hypothetical protein HKD37_01G000931 [Glycine soja]